MKALLQLWDRYWFASVPERNLRWARRIFAGHALWILLSRDLSSLAALPEPFWSGVSSGVRWRYLLYPGHAGLERTLELLAVIALALCFAGVRPRVSGCFAGLLLYHLAPLETFFWTPSPYERGLTIDVLALLALSFAPPRAPWGLRLAQMFLAQVYLFAGWSKLVRVGPEWISAENLRRWLLVFVEQDQVAVFREPGLWIASSPLLCGLVAAGAVAVDLAFITVLFSRRARAWLVPAALAMNVGILFTMNIAFLNIPQLLVYVDWERLRVRLGRRTVQE